MKTIALAMTAALGLSLASPAFAAEPDSGSVGQFVQWQRAPLPAQHVVRTEQVAKQAAPATQQQPTQVAHR